jgi:predicted transcriptional regulator
LVTTQESHAPYNSVRMPNVNQPTGKVRELARKIYIEQPFLPQQEIAKLLKVSTARVAQVLKDMSFTKEGKRVWVACVELEKQRKEAQKCELERIKTLYKSQL